MRPGPLRYLRTVLVTALSAMLTRLLDVNWLLHATLGRGYRRRDEVWWQGRQTALPCHASPSLPGGVALHRCALTRFN